MIYKDLNPNGPGLISTPDPPQLLTKGVAGAKKGDDADSAIIEASAQVVLPLLVHYHRFHHNRFARRLNNLKYEDKAVHEKMVVGTMFKRVFNADFHKTGQGYLLLLEESHCERSIPHKRKQIQILPAFAGPEQIVAGTDPHLQGTGEVAPCRGTVLLPGNRDTSRYLQAVRHFESRT